jgi:ankyrin repeat protein
MARSNKELNHSLNTFLYRRDMTDGHGSSLMWAAAHNRPSTTRNVFEYCKGMQLQASCLHAALVVATENCSWAVIKILIANGADANTKTRGFGHVLQAASWKGDADLVRSLLSAGAEVNALAGHYGNALQAAAWNGHDRVAKLLLSKGADVNAEGGHYGNALAAASWGGHQNMVQQLVSHGAMVNLEGGFYGSALQAACWSGEKEVVQTLLQAGADTDTKGEKCENALIVAFKRAHVSVALLVLTSSIRESVRRKLSMLARKRGED